VVPAGDLESESKTLSQCDINSAPRLRLHQSRPRRGPVCRDMGDRGQRQRPIRQDTIVQTKPMVTARRRPEHLPWLVSLRL